MVDYKYKNLFEKSHVDKQLRIETDDGLFVATNEDIHFEDFQLTESLCSNSDLRFGSCEASMVKFQIRNAFIPLAGKWLTITETLDGNTDIPFQYGRYKVFSDVPTADKEYRDIVAYDAMYDILNSEVSAWYNKILPNKDSSVTIKSFRESFSRYFGLEENLPEGGLVNDLMVVKKTIQAEEISGKDVITAICEINGCFGHIGRDGKFHYIYLQQDIQGLYPADFLFPDHVPAQWDYLSQAETGHLYPQDPKGTNFGAGKYIKMKYEDYIVRTINKLQIRKEENDIGVIYGTGNNCYIIEDNFLVYGKGSSELQTIASNLYQKIRGVIYRPFAADCVGNPCLEVGDPVRFPTKYMLVESYILKRNLKGIQALRDAYEAEGTEQRAEQVNSVHKSIIQLKGKSNTLTRTLEETRLEMRDSDEKLSNTISVTAKEIRTELTDTANGLSTRISQNANGLSAEVSRATSAEGNLSSRIDVNANQILLKVSKGDVTGQLNSELTIDGNSINLTTGHFTINSKNITLDSNGNATFSGTLNAATGSFSGNITATSGSFENVSATNATFTNCSISSGCSWSGNSIGGGYIGSGINGSNISAGTVGNSFIASSLSGKSYSGTLYGSASSVNLNSCNIPNDRLYFANNSYLYCYTSNGGSVGLQMGSSNGALHIKNGSGSTSVISAGSSQGSYFSGNLSVYGNLEVTGNFDKNKIVSTENYGMIRMSSYETSEPMYGDVGSSETDEAGIAFVQVDPVFGETIESGCEKYIFLTKYGEGELYVDTPSSSDEFFCIKGTPNTRFVWEIKAVQKNFKGSRLRTYVNNDVDEEMPDYEREAEAYTNNFERSIEINV